MCADGGTGEMAGALVEWTGHLCERLGCRTPFAEFGLSRDDYPAIVDAALASGSTKANPRPVEAADVVALLDRAM